MIEQPDSQFNPLLKLTRQRKRRPTRLVIRMFIFLVCISAPLILNPVATWSCHLYSHGV